ncbi:MAG: S-layer homology domain-containing protein, partial [Clostridiales bacterium]
MKMKKSLTLLLAIMTILSIMAIPAFATANKTTTAPITANFLDTTDHWASAAIDRWSGYGIIKGDHTGHFRPDANLTRGEMATIISNLLGLSHKADNTYADLKGSEWYADAVLKCTALGILKGDGSNCNATTSISRQEATVMLGRALGMEPAATPDLSTFTDAASVAPWAAGYVSAMAKNHIINGMGEGKFSPNLNINRASVMTILDQAITDYINKAGTYTINSVGLTVVAVPNVILENSKLTNLLVAEGVGEGDFTLLNTKVTGSTVARGGGINSFIIMGDSDIAKIIISKIDGAIRISVQGKANVTVVEIKDGRDDVFIEGKFNTILVATNT